tara:strand:- start:420 stop:911 length:492 start_codon:yes stop_codon:yes gene_type:complete
MPQLNPEFFISQLFWLAITFSFLFVFLWRISLPRISTVIEKRQRKIEDNISDAKELQEQAMIIEKNINQKLQKAKDETSDKIKGVIGDIQSDADKRLLELDKELDNKISKAEENISQNKKMQIEQINSEIVNISKIIIEKVANMEISKSDLEKSLKPSKDKLN